jgi:hypothetical protein
MLRSACLRSKGGRRRYVVGYPPRDGGEPTVLAAVGGGERRTHPDGLMPLKRSDCSGVELAPNVQELERSSAVFR